MRVPAEWPRGGKECKLVLLGEAPGEEETERGRPFVGRSGKCLDHMLSSAGIDRKECLVTNVFEEKAEGNNVAPWMRDPALAVAVRERLGRELAAARPNIVVALGATALWALTGMEALGKVRGSLLPATLVGKGLKVLPTLHPAFVLRQYEMLTVVVGDLQKALRESQFPQIIHPIRELWLDPNLDDLVRAWDCMKNAPMLSLDIETGWGQISHFGVAWRKECGLSVPFVDARFPGKSYWRTAEQEVDAWKFVKRVCESPIPKVGQFYGNYDALVLLKKMGIKTMNYCDDTYVCHGALHPELKRDLAFLGARYSEQGAWKNMGRRQGGEEKDNG